MSAICCHPSKIPAPLSPRHKYFSRFAPDRTRDNGKRLKRLFGKQSKSLAISETALCVQMKTPQIVASC